MSKEKETTKIDAKFNPANPSQPISLKRIDELKAKLVGNPQDKDQVLEWEKQAKRALLTIDLSQHQGVRLFLAGIIQLIQETNELLQNAMSDELSTSQRDGLVEKRNFMLWIIDFFKDARTDLKSIEEELEYQLDGEVEADVEDELLDEDDLRGKI